MHIDSCRDLKSSILTRLPDLGLRAEVAEWLALGITRRSAETYSLAVRVPETTPAGDVLARISDEARQEVDVRGVGRIEPFRGGEDLQRRHRPVVPGCSIAHPDVTAGTLGGFVTVDGDVHVLSNNHVLANSDQGEVGDAALQPGPADGGRNPQDRVATLAAMVDLVTERPNTVDGAVARVDDGIEVDPPAYPGGALGEPLPGPPEEDDVEKIGRTTGHTTGRITAFEVDGLRITYPEGPLVFDDQIEITGKTGAFSSGGDSGSVIWTRRQRRGVGLLFAGSTRGGPNGSGLTYANVLSTALQQLGATWLRP